MTTPTQTMQAGAGCPGLSVLRGLIGNDINGNPIPPPHVPYGSRCGNCGQQLNGKS